MLKEMKLTWIDGLATISFRATPAHALEILKILEDSQSRLTQDERNLLANAQYISAVKNVRNRTGLPLREAKDMVDAERYKR